MHGLQYELMRPFELRVKWESDSSTSHFGQRFDSPFMFNRSSTKIARPFAAYGNERTALHNARFHV
jgi:hypothetical protein